MMHPKVSIYDGVIGLPLKSIHAPVCTGMERTLLLSVAPIDVAPFGEAYKHHSRCDEHLCAALVLVLKVDNVRLPSCR
jgi:hypothetical protein